MAENLSEIPGENVHKAIYEIIENKLNSKTFKLNLSSASKQGENNFLGVVYRLSFDKNDELENTTGSSMIVKVAPQNESLRTFCHSRDLFLQEMFVYNKVLPFFRQFEESKGATIEENRFTEYPTCYRTLDEEPHECLLLEDLSIRGFSIIDRFTEDVTADHVFLFMHALGKFHAISFALKDQQPKKFKEFSTNLRELFRIEDSHIRDYLNLQVEKLMKILNNEEDRHLLVRVKDLFEKDVADIVADCLDPKSAEPEAIICYGDAWQNNSMYRYNDQQKPIEIIFLDWQISRYASPIIDVVYFIFCCTTKELRDCHYDDFLKIYHNSLSAHIRRLGSDPDKLFPFTLMQEHLHKFGKIGLIFATMILPMITAEKGNAIDMDDIANNMTNNQNTDKFDFFSSENSRIKFNKRLRDVAIDMARLGYI